MSRINRELIVYSGKNKGTRIALPNKPILVGRDSQCYLRLESKSVRKQHASLESLPTGIAVRDLGDGLGTIVNGTPTMEHVLNPGDILQIGKFEFFMPHSALGAHVSQPLSSFIGTMVYNDEMPQLSKTNAIREMAHQVCDRRLIAYGDTESIAASVMKREQLGTTGIGRGVAVPHTKHPAVSSHWGGIFYFPDPIDFESIDGEPTDMAMFLVSDPNRPGDHLRAIELFSVVGNQRSKHPYRPTDDTLQSWFVRQIERKYRDQ